MSSPHPRRLTARNVGLDQFGGAVVRRDLYQPYFSPA
jgi:hypothetical protein